MVRSLVCLAALSLTAAGGPIDAAVYLVLPDGTGDFATIQEAVSAAAPGDIVELGDGTFTGDGNRDVDFLGKAITVLSRNGNSSIQCDGTETEPHRALLFTTGEGEDSVVQGIHISGGFAEEGGAVYCENASPTMIDCVMQGNRALGEGGALYCRNGSPRITGCDFAFNVIEYEGRGAGASFYESAPVLTDCGLMNNQIGQMPYHRGWGAGISSSGGTASIELVRCRIEGNRQGGGEGAGAFLGGVRAILTDCTVGGNSTEGEGWQGGGIRCTAGTLTMSGCTVSGNITQGPMAWGGGLSIGYSNVSISNCCFWDNLADKGGGLFCQGATGRVEGCTFGDNRALVQGGAIACGSAPSPEFLRCTLAQNGSPLGGGVSYSGSPGATLRNTIIALSDEGEAVYREGTGTATVTCCDFYGNAGGDWSGSVADLLGRYGNICTDPIFCNSSYGDCHVAFESPCLRPDPSYGDGIIGSCGGACGLVITSVDDIPNDQGRWIRLRWDRAFHDRAGSGTTITSYSIWRRIDPLAGRALSFGGGSAAPASHGMLRWPPGEWEFILDLPACGEEQYAAPCPALCDSTAADGICWSVFFVRAHTPDPLVFYDCFPDSGYAIDNLAPQAPLNLHFDGPGRLAWDPSEDNDFDYFTVYGSSRDSLDETAEVIGFTTACALELPAPFSFYLVTATDFSGNESGTASLADQSAGEEGAPARPERTILHPCRPNPLEPGTTMRYDLAAVEHVCLEILDVAGRLVRTLVDRKEAAGIHAVEWDGSDECGVRVRSGVYFCRLRTSVTRETRRMAVLE